MYTYNVTNILFLPEFTISQSVSASNDHLMSLMGSYLMSLNITTLVGKTPSVSYMKIVGVTNIQPFHNLLAPHIDLLYWKLPQYDILVRVVALMQLLKDG